MASNLQRNNLSPYAKETYLTITIYTNAERHSSLSRLAANSSKIASFLFTIPRTLLPLAGSRRCSLEVPLEMRCLAAFFLPLRHFSPPKFSIGVAPVATLAVFRPLPVKKREPPCRCSNSFKYRNVSSPSLLHPIMTVVLLFIIIQSIYNN